MVVGIWEEGGLCGVGQELAPPNRWTGWQAWDSQQQVWVMIGWAGGEGLARESLGTS